MFNFKIRIVNSVFQINGLNDELRHYFSYFLSNENPNYTIDTSEINLYNRESSDLHLSYDDIILSELHREISGILLEKNVVVFHGTSFKVGNSAFIITARSGVGKSTHAKLLQNYLGDKFIYINDDKPLISCMDSPITVYSSPWNGKERRGNNISAPLKAIIFLNRAETNSCRKVLDKKEIYFKLLSQVYIPKDKEKAKKALEVVDIIYKNINFYEINVNMDISAAKMTYEEIIKNEIK